MERDTEVGVEKKAHLISTDGINWTETTRSPRPGEFFATSDRSGVLGVAHIPVPAWQIIGELLDRDPPSVWQRAWRYLRRRVARSA